MEIELGKYRHFKGGEYEVIGVGRHSETLEELVFYRALYESKEFGKDALWARPLTLFTETVMHNGEEVLRFKKV
ncbi:DUF1653 domain-containing protein [Candidatus Kaiserbacteria bacterium]|nr:MAG: DUF1653 domain-containing protein [Candidatus Kaiserbacteria bacterium]